MKFILSIYDSQTKELVDQIQKSSNPKSMYRNWLKSKCNKVLKVDSQFTEKQDDYIGFYHCLSNDPQKMKCGMVSLSEDDNINSDFIISERNLFFVAECTCCPETWAIGCSEVTLSSFKEKLFYFIDDKFTGQKKYVATLNLIEFMFLGFNPWQFNEYSDDESYVKEILN